MTDEPPAHGRVRPVAYARTRRPTAHDVAELAGVSQSAVSRAFTPGASISSDARTKVEAAARQLGYRPNLIARSLITQRSNTIGVAMGYMENQFYPAMLEALSTAFASAGYRVLLFTPSPDGQTDPILDEVLRYRVDAVILASASLTSHFADECAQAQVPVVLLNRRTKSQTVSTITGDNKRGGRVIAAFLASGGHKRLAYVAGLENSSTSQEREEGFRRGVRRAGLQAPVRVVGNYDFATTRTAARSLFARTERPDGIFCSNDHTAFAVMDVAMGEFGLKAGKDFSIIGFDNVPLAEWQTFDLTTYSQPIALMAERVVAVTIKHVTEGRFEAVHEIVSGQLIVRGSTRPQS